MAEFVAVLRIIASGASSNNQSSTPQNDTHSYVFQPEDQTYVYQARRSPRITTYLASRKREDIADIVGSDSSNDNSGGCS